MRAYRKGFSLEKNILIVVFLFASMPGLTVSVVLMLLRVGIVSTFTVTITVVLTDKLGIYGR